MVPSRRSKSTKYQPPVVQTVDIGKFLNFPGSGGRGKFWKGLAEGWGTCLQESKIRGAFRSPWPGRGQSGGRLCCAPGTR